MSKETLSTASEAEHIRRIVRNRTTGKFLDEEGNWTEFADRALIFPTFLTAVTWCLESGLPHAEVVLRSEPFESEIAVPI